jgi:hypothetical protein
MANLSLSAVSVAVYTALNVAGLTALVSTRIYDSHIPRTPTYPFVSCSASKNEARGLGVTEMPEITLRVSAFSTSDTAAEVQAIAAKVEDLLKDAALTVAGYTMAGKVVWRDTVEFAPMDINGALAHETVCQFTLWLVAT